MDNSRRVRQSENWSLMRTTWILRWHPKYCQQSHALKIDVDRILTVATPVSGAELDVEETVIVEVERVPETVMTRRDVTVEWLVERPSDE